MSLNQYHKSGKYYSFGVYITAEHMINYISHSVREIHLKNTINNY